MLIKAAASRARDVEVLTALLDHPHASKEVRSRIQDELRKIHGGAKGEAEAAYEIDFHFGPSHNWAVIHDLRLEWRGRVAQIDHLLIGRALDVWVCESKHFSQGVKINEQGEFTAFWNRVPYGVASPLEQNRKHVMVLSEVLSSSMFAMPTRLGLALRPNFESVVLVSKGATITRPEVKVDGLDRVIKNDQLRSMVDRHAASVSTVSALTSLTKVISSDSLEQLSTRIAQLHRPIEFDWHARFGLATKSASTPQRETPPTRADLGELRSDTLAPTAAPASQASRGAADEAVATHKGRLSTSKFATARGWRTAEALTRLVAAGYLEVDGEQHRLTASGYQAGGRFIEKSRFGPYFLWPVGLDIG